MKKFKFKSIWAILLVFALVIYGVFIEPNRLDVTKYTIQDKELAGIKIVFASDFHVKPHQQKRLKNIVAVINAQNPDIVLSAGDFVSGHLPQTTMPIEDIANGLGKIDAKYGFYTTLGNHDQWYGVEDVISTFEKNNIRVLHNKNIKINIRNKDVYIAGIQYKPYDRSIIWDSLEGTKQPVIMLTHSPDEFPDIPKTVNLTLAGHTHGGQVRIPLFGPIFTCSIYHDKYAQGLINENGKKLITTRGIGVSILPIRFNCPPEIVVIEFVK
jgi:predicted MPP superfamily phosphohydrolase